MFSNRCITVLKACLALLIATIIIGITAYAFLELYGDHPLRNFMIALFFIMLLGVLLVRFTIGLIEDVFQWER